LVRTKSLRLITCLQRCMAFTTELTRERLFRWMLDDAIRISLLIFLKICSRKTKRIERNCALCAPEASQIQNSLFDFQSETCHFQMDEKCL
jgi:hypothetical protein